MYQYITYLIQNLLKASLEIVGTIWLS